MSGQAEKIVIDGRSFEKFICWPAEVDDGTLRCIRCGQIDELEYHDTAICRARFKRGARP